MATASLLLFLLAIAFVFLLDVPFDNDAWKTYRNAAYGYEVRYPRDWLIEARDPELGDDFETQYVVISKGVGQIEVQVAVAHVLVAVNFQGDWCTAGRVGAAREISVSGMRGQEYICLIGEGSDCQPRPACEREPQNIVRYFAGARGKQNYTVWSKLLGELATVRKIIESFRFLE